MRHIGNKCQIALNWSAYNMQYNIAINDYWSHIFLCGAFFFLLFIVFLLFFFFIFVRFLDRWTIEENGYLSITMENEMQLRWNEMGNVRYNSDENQMQSFLFIWSKQQKQTKNENRQRWNWIRKKKMKKRKECVCLTKQAHIHTNST